MIYLLLITLKIDFNKKNIRSPRLKCTAGKNTQLCVCVVCGVRLYDVGAVI